MQLPDGGKVQVKYLANRAPGAGAWINEHVVRSAPGVDWYALVIIECFQISGVTAFPADLAPVCRALGKRHPNQDTTLQFGRRNWLAVVGNQDRFRALGLRVWLPPFTAAVSLQGDGPVVGVRCNPVAVRSKARPYRGSQLWRMPILGVRRSAESSRVSATDHPVRPPSAERSRRDVAVRVQEQRERSVETSSNQTRMHKDRCAELPNAALRGSRRLRRRSSPASASGSGLGEARRATTPSGPEVKHGREEQAGEAALMRAVEIGPSRMARPGIRLCHDGRHASDIERTHGDV